MWERGSSQIKTCKAVVGKGATHRVSAVGGQSFLEPKAQILRMAQRPIGQGIGRRGRSRDAPGALPYATMVASEDLFFDRGQS